MVGVGGSIGTGIPLGSGAAMQIAGPAAILSFIAAAFICFTVAMALGELASAHPAAGSFGIYGELYLNPSAIFGSRWLLDRHGAQHRRRGSPTAAPHRSGQQRWVVSIMT